MNRLRIFLSKFLVANRSAHDWLVMLRIGVSISLIVKILTEFRFLDLLYGSKGLVPIEISHFSQLPLIPSVYGLSQLIACCTESHFLMGFFLCQLLFASFLLMGFLSRFSAFMCWLMQVIVFNSTHLTSYGFDAVLLSMLFYTMIFPAGKYFSFDNILRAKKPQADTSMIFFYQKIIQLHVCIIYFVNGVSKMGHNWQDGSGIWDAVNQPQFQSFLTPFWQSILLIEHVPALVTWSTIIVEIAYPFLVWVRGVNTLLLILIILLHAFIAVVFGLWQFAFLMIILNLVAFGHLLLPKRKAVQL